jgi:dihydrodipicolinate synthase/N-acetylneuraminate lyase
MTVMMLSRCGNVGKLTRICATVSDPTFPQLYPRMNPDAPFLVLGGFADFILSGTYANGHGAIIGLANVAPVSSMLYHSHKPSKPKHICPIIACNSEALPDIPANPQR